LLLRLFKRLQALESRTQFILGLLIMSFIIIISLILYYPGYLSGIMKDQYTSRYQRMFQQPWLADTANLSDNRHYFNALKTMVSMDPDVECAILRSDDTTSILPMDYNNLHRLRAAADGELVKTQTGYFLRLNYLVDEKNNSKDIFISLAINAQEIISKKREAQKGIIFFGFLTILIIYLSSLIFSQTVYRPLKRLGNHLKMLSSGQLKLSTTYNYSAEFTELDNYLKSISRKISKLQKQKKDMPYQLEEAVKKAKTVQNELDQEVKKMSALVMLSIRLNKEREQKKILKQINEEITGELNYQFSAVFIQDKNALKYHSSKLKGLVVLDKKLAKDFENYIIGFDSPEYAEISAGKPYLTSRPHFHHILDQNNITAQMAMVPISTASQLKGMLVVGFLGKDHKLDESDLEKLTLLGNILALNIENLEAIKNLSRNVQLRTEELETTNKLLSESIMERDNMLKLVSHDLNAPLRNVIGLVDSIYRKYKGELSEDLVDRINRIRNNINKERKMIKDVLLNFRALEADSTDEEINMHKLMISIKDELQHELEKKSIDFIIPDELPKIKARQHLIRHIFLNLVDNASKYLPEDQKGNRIIIDAKEGVDEITYSIADNGTGIPQHKQLDIFSSYKSLQSIRELEFTGLGLGLALVKNIVEKMSGRIWVKSKSGKGTTFFISFRKGKFEQIARK